MLNKKKIKIFRCKVVTNYRHVPVQSHGFAKRNFRKAGPPSVLVKTLVPIEK